MNTISADSAADFGGGDDDSDSYDDPTLPSDDTDDSSMFTTLGTHDADLHSNPSLASFGCSLLK
jgi:hypothetical protein